MTTATAPHARFVQNVSSGWLARRWYYTPKSHRAYSVRQISPGDRRLLAEFVSALTPAEREAAAVRDLADMLFDRVLAGGPEMSVGFAALESAEAGGRGGDRVIGATAYAPLDEDAAMFGVAVAQSHRGEQVGRILLAMLIRHAKRVGVKRLTAVMHWANRPMHALAQSMGFTLEPVPGDREARRLVLGLK